jgi:hypothetical protein
MSKKLKPTRAERRARRAAIPSEGVYGVDATDAGADGWFSRYLLWASDEREAKARIRQRAFIGSSTALSGAPVTLRRKYPGSGAWLSRLVAKSLQRQRVVSVGGTARGLPPSAAGACRHRPIGALGAQRMTSRLHSSIGHVPPLEYEPEYYRHTAARQRLLPGELSLH